MAYTQQGQKKYEKKVPVTRGQNIHPCARSEATKATKRVTAKGSELHPQSQVDKRWEKVSAKKGGETLQSRWKC